MNYKVSVCISVFNSEKFLKRCIDSILSQTLEEIQIVIVNDGSTDNSGKIIDEYEGLYPDKLVCVKQENRGLAQGRQMGINNATGQFIAFLDADDYVRKDAYEKMYNSAIKHGVDIVECETVRGDKIISSEYNGVHECHKILKEYFNFGELQPMLWLRMYRQELFTDNTLPTIHVNNEDIFAFPLLLHNAKSIYFLKEPLHVYSVDNEESVMNIVKGLDYSKILNNRRKTLEVVPFLLKSIGVDNINEKYSEEFEFFKARTILNFSLSRLGRINVTERLEIASTATGCDVMVLNPYFRKLNHFNNWIQLTIRFLGLRSTIRLYLFFKYRQL